MATVGRHRFVGEVRPDGDPGTARRRESLPSIPATLPVDRLAAALLEVGELGSVNRLRLHGAGVAERLPVPATPMQVWSVPAAVAAGPPGADTGRYRSLWRGSGVGSTRREGLEVRSRTRSLNPGVFVVRLQPVLVGWTLAEDDAAPVAVRRGAQPWWFVVGAVPSPEPGVRAATDLVVSRWPLLCDSTGVYWSAVRTAMESDGPVLLGDARVLLSGHHEFRPTPW